MARKRVRLTPFRQRMLSRWQRRWAPWRFMWPNDRKRMNLHEATHLLRWRWRDGPSIRWSQWPKREGKEWRAGYRPRRAADRRMYQGLEAYIGRGYGEKVLAFFPAQFDRWADKPEETPVEALKALAEVKAWVEEYNAGGTRREKALKAGARSREGTVEVRFRWIPLMNALEKARLRERGDNLEVGVYEARRGSTLVARFPTPTGVGMTGIPWRTMLAEMENFVYVWAEEFEAGGARRRFAMEVAKGMELARGAVQHEVEARMKLQRKAVAEEEEREKAKREEERRRIEERVAREERKEEGARSRYPGLMAEGRIDKYFLRHHARLPTLREWWEDYAGGTELRWDEFIDEMGDMPERFMDENCNYTQPEPRDPPRSEEE